MTTFVNVFDQLATIAVNVRKAPSTTLRRMYVKAFRDWAFAEIEETHASLGAALGASAGAPSADSPAPAVRQQRRRATAAPE